MKFDILTTFPNAFSYLNESILKRAQKNQYININIHDLRQWAEDKHKTTDDTPYGGGAGMLMKIDPIYKALRYLEVYPHNDSSTRIILTSAKGKNWNQAMVKKYASTYKRIILICGHYEGVDHRVSKYLADEEISIGNFVLSGGELAAMVITDSVSRLISGVLGNPESLDFESHNSDNSLEYPHYTRPAEFKNDLGEVWGVPDVLVSGNHKAIDKWRKENSK